MQSPTPMHAHDIFELRDRVRMQVAHFEEMRPNPLDEIQKAIAALSGDSSEMVTTRRLFIRVTGTISPNGKVHSDVAEFQRRAAMILLELELATGDDLYGGIAELTAIFEPLRAAIEAERRRKVN